MDAVAVAMSSLSASNLEGIWTAMCSSSLPGQHIGSVQQMQLQRSLPSMSSFLFQMYMLLRYYIKQLGTVLVVEGSP